MIAAVQDRREARVYSYNDREELVKQVQLFMVSLAVNNSETSENLSRILHSRSD